MNLAKKLAKIFSLIFLAFHLASCDSGCVEPDEFDNEASVVLSNPVDDGVDGSYNHVDGGQRATWHKTGLKSNGEQFVIQVSGAWVPWYGNEMNNDKLKALPKCNFCAKKFDASGVPTQNCLCRKDQDPLVEVDASGSLLQGRTLLHPNGVDCSDTTTQNDPSKCTCTTKFGSATDYGVYHFPLDIYNKQEALKIADEAVVCKYSDGMGLYLGLFGQSGNEIPARAHHLFSQESVCDITRNSNHECLNSTGTDVTKYIFRSANETITIKDDKNKNDGLDRVFADDEYHKPNEDVKLIIYDRYYSDNYGQYNVTFLKGVGRENTIGLLEFLVTLIEETVMGKVDVDDGQRHGGIIEFMYNSIVKDSGFITIVQISLAFYIMFFGVATLMGIVEITKKELMNRLLKIVLIIFFTSPQSWYFYNKIIISFFKDGMDYVVTIFLNLSDKNIDSGSLIKVAQMDRAIDTSNATRFSYIDLIIKKLFSTPVTKKIWGLFFGSPFFGLIYIPVIYAAIAFFLYTMVMAAMFYVINIVKLAFVLSLGPIFMIFTLFAQTNQMFKNWLSFIGARSLEIILLFVILYNFIAIIDKEFMSLLTYRACVEVWSIGPISLKILRSEVSRSFIEWITSLVKIGGLIFITKQLLDKAGDITGNLISIGGVANKDSDGASYGGGGFKAAGGMLADGLKLARKGAGKALDVAKSAGAFGVEGATAAARASGVAGAWNKLGEKIPFRGIRTRARDSIVDAAINKSRKEGLAKGLGAKPLELDRHIRSSVQSELQSKMHNNTNKMAYLGVNTESINKRLDQKLVRDGLKNFLKAEAKKMKDPAHGGATSGKDTKEALNERAKAWANANLSGGEASIKSHLNNVKDYIKEQSKLSDSKNAVELYANNPDMQHKYMQNLQRESERKQKERQEAEKGIFSGLANKASRAYHSLRRDTANNPKMTQRNFMKRLEKKSGDEGLAEKMKADLRAGLHADYEGEKNRIKNSYAKKMEGAPSRVKQNLEKKRDAKLKEVDDGKDAARNRLKASYQKEFSEQNSGFSAKNNRRDFMINHLRKNAAELEKLAKDEKDADKQQEFAKQLKDCRENLAGMEEERSKDATIQKTRTEFEDAQKAYNKRMEELSQLDGQKLKDAIRSHGGMEAIKDGLMQINGETLFEKKARLEMIDPNAKIELSTALSSDKLKDISSPEAAASIASALASKGSSTLVEMNATAADALLKASNVGLQAGNVGLEAGNILLGGPAVKADIDAAVTRGYDSAKMRVKTSEMELKMIKYEKETLADKLNQTPEEKARLKSLEKDFADLERSVAAATKEEENFKQVMDSYK